MRETYIPQIKKQVLKDNTQNSRQEGYLKTMSKDSNRKKNNSQQNNMAEKERYQWNTKMTIAIIVTYQT